MADEVIHLNSKLSHTVFTNLTNLVLVKQLLPFAFPLLGIQTHFLPVNCLRIGLIILNTQLNISVQESSSSKHNFRNNDIVDC